MKVVRKYKPMTMGQFEAKFPTEEACKSYLQARRWPEGVKCPRCGNDKVYELSTRPYHWQCEKCTADGYRFSVLVGTIFENTNIKLRDWFKVIYLMLTSKKGISALQVQRMLGFGSYRTAWSMCHRIRVALGEGDFRKLIGFVEIDETYVGGKAKNKHKGPGGRGGMGGTGAHGNKTIVAGAVQRKGKVVARVIEKTDGATIERFVREVVSEKVSLLCADEYRGYDKLSKYFPLGRVNHGADQYVVGAVHTNTIEGFWSLIKRGIMGTFHKVSPKYLPLYVNEFQFRYNNRNNPNIFANAIAEC
jgi:transposase-like protein